MRVTPIPRPLEGEHVLGVAPPMERDGVLVWHRRLNLYTGRTLSDTALTTEQDGRAGHLTTHGRLVSPGVVVGLELDIARQAERVGIERVDGQERPRLGHRCEIAPGWGVTASGEDVMVPRPLRVVLEDAWVPGPPELLLGPDEDVPPEGPPSGRPLGTLIRVGAPIPTVGILLLEPVVAERIDRLDPEDPCEQDVANYAFEDWQLADGCRLVLYPWPLSLGQLPPSNDRWRNRLAYAIFERERTLGPVAVLPWEAVGLPIALVGFQPTVFFETNDPIWDPAVVDRAAVVRSGGKARRRAGLAEDGQPVLAAGSSFLWQARVQQLAEHLADPALLGKPVGVLANQLRHLPPVGLLPKDAFEPRRGRQHFFPSSYAVEAVPVPLEQLELVMRDSASLAPFDTSLADQVRALVPVPQIWYEPRLLHVEQVDPQFQREIDRIAERRSVMLTRRRALRRALAAHSAAVGGPYPSRDADSDAALAKEPDPGQLEREEVVVPPFASSVHLSSLRTGFHQHFFTGAPPLQINAGDLLIAYVFLDPDNPPRQLMVQWHDGQGWEHRAYWGASLMPFGVEGTNSRRAMGALPEAGRWVRLEVPAERVGLAGVAIRGMAFALQDGRAAWGQAGKAFPDAPPEADSVWLRGAPPIGATPSSVTDTVEPWIEAQGFEFLSSFEDAYGTQVSGDRRLVTIIEDLKQQLRTATPIERRTLEVLSTNVTAAVPSALQDRFGIDGQRSLSFRGTMTASERDTLQNLSADTSYKLAIQAMFTRSQNNHLAKLDELGLVRFIEFLEERVRRADDRIDFGFLRVQTDIYRLRQLMVGAVEATRLATSPVLASIAKGESALGIRAELSKLSRPRNNPGRAEDGGVPFDVTAAAAAAEGPNVADDPSALTFGSSQLGSAFLAGGVQEIMSSGFELGATSVTAGPPSAAPVSPQIASGAIGRFFGGGLAEAALGGVDVGIAGPPAKEAIVEQAPIVGKALDFRTVTVAQRLAEAPAAEAKSFGVASKYEVVKTLAELDLNIEDLEVPGFYAYNQDGTVATETVQVVANNVTKTRTIARELRHSFGVIAKGQLLNEILVDRHDPDPADADESAFFAAGVRALDHATATLRLVEGRIQGYRQAIALCRKALQEIRALTGRANARLKVVGDELAQARHDVAVARALLDEETKRVAAINERRDRIIAEHVQFMAYCRPRTTDLLDEAPVRAIDPAPTEQAVPACLAHDADVPPELRSLIGLLREAPVTWFTHLPRLLDRLDHLPLLHELLGLARLRAQTRMPLLQVETRSQIEISGVSRALDGVLSAQRQVIAQQRMRTAQLDLVPLQALGWQGARDRAAEVVSLGDLVDGAEGRSDVARRAARELDDIAQVATCLYERLREVLPAIRLGWAERVSQFDAPISLRSFVSLPRWGEIELLDRRDMEALAEWLFQRVDPRQPAAVGLINDVVRVCILVASHAPVGRIIAGRVAAPTRILPGVRVPLAIDLSRVRIGMQVLMFAGQQVAARGVVEDLTAGQAAARIVQITDGMTELDRDAAVQVAEPATFERQAAAFGSSLGGGLRLH